MKSFLIYTYDYDPGIGGIKVMHKLCDILNTHGYKSYLMPIHISDTFYVNSEYNTPLVTQEILNNLDDVVVIYPEGIRYNPLNAKNIVRWILGPSKEADYITYSKSDLVYWYMDYYYVEALGHKENVLQISEFHENIFKDLEGYRNGSCYAIRKGTPKQLVHPFDAIELPYSAAGNLVQLATLFNSVETFYCYDNYTFLYIQAAMCGCTSIVIPDGSRTREEWMNGSPLHRYGIAYGEVDIPRAKETLPLLLEEVENQKQLMIRQVIEFVDKCNKVFI